MCQKYPGTRWLLGRSKLVNLRATTLKTLREQLVKTGTLNQTDFNPNKTTITWNNGSEIVLKDLFSYPSDPDFDSLGSLEITGAFVDEIQQISYKAWQVIKSRIRFKLNENGLIPKALGTCNPSKNWVYREFYKPARERKLKDGRAFVRSLPTDNNFLPETYLKSLLELDDATRQRLYFGNWEYDADPAKLIEFDCIVDLWKNNHVKPTGKRFISADVARFGSDKGVIIVWDGLVELETVTLSLSSITETAAEIKRLANNYGVQMSKIIVDEDGVGGGVVDILRCKGFVNGSKPLKEKGQIVEYNNLKSQCYFYLAKIVNNGEMLLKTTANSDKITEELEQVKRYNADRDGKLATLPKDEIKKLIGRSPDFSDALAMRMFFEIKTSIDDIFLY